MLEWLRPTCITIVIVVVFSCYQLWIQLLKWKKFTKKYYDWAQRYKAWVGRNCTCDHPGGDPEPDDEPGWP